MPFDFQLPTTSYLSLSASFNSTTHPSLPFAATTQRNILRDVLKKHKRLSPQSKVIGLQSVVAALDDYIPYILALDTGLVNESINGVNIEVSIHKEVKVNWRSTLSSSIPGREPPRIKGKSLEYEVHFVLATLAYTYSQLARSQLHTLFAPITPTAEQRSQIIQTATRHLLGANSVFRHLSSRALETDASRAVVETLSQTHSALAALSLAEATLLAVLKDDPYPFVIAQSRNKDDKDWMIKPPDLPKVRAHLFARLCLAASEHAGRAEAGLSASGRVDGDLIDYVRDLRRTARAKACRFLGIDSELAGECGKGIAWLVGGRKELGFASQGDDDRFGKLKGLNKFRRDWTERREDKKIEKGGEWGSDAGRLEELRVIEYLESKWSKENDTVRFISVKVLYEISHIVVDQHATHTTIQPIDSEHAFRQRRAFAQTFRSAKARRRHSFANESTS